MNSAPKISVSFVISGRDFDPDACSAALGLQPSNIWRQQREHLKNVLALPNVEWQLGFEGKEFYSLDEATSEVVALIWPTREQVRTFVSQNGLRATLACSVRIDADRPEYCLSSDVMSKLGWLDCKFCLDIFDYSE